MTSRPTLKDIAKAAGVSQMTVSRVVRNHSAVTASTRQRVQNAIDRMGYVPNKLAGSLAHQRSSQIAVIIPSMVNNVFTQVLSGITQELARTGYNPVVGISDYDMTTEEELLIAMLSWRPAGIIVTSLVHSARSNDILRHAGVPVVEMMDIDRAPIDMAVGLDHRAAACALAAYLLERGYRRFGYLGWKSNDFSAAARFEATRHYLEARGYSLTAPDIYDRPPDAMMGKEGMAALLERAGDIDAVLFSNDLAAVGGMMFCLERGLNVPGDIALAGFSGLRIGQTLPRSLTTIRTRRFRTGRLAARNVLNALAGGPVEQVTDTGFELVCGQSA